MSFYNKFIKNENKMKKLITIILFMLLLVGSFAINSTPKPILL